MEDHVSCTVKRTFKEKWICPYCKEEIGKTIYVESGTGKTSVSVYYGSMMHRQICRVKKMMESRGYKIIDIDCCLNCKNFSESCYETYEPDVECQKARGFTINPLGHCSEHKRVKE